MATGEGEPILESDTGPPSSYGNLGCLEGRQFLEQMVKTRIEAIEDVRVDLKSFLSRHSDGRLPAGGAALPTGGGIPKVGSRLPGGLPSPDDDDGTQAISSASTGDSTTPSFSPGVVDEEKVSQDGPAAEAN